MRVVLFLMSIASAFSQTETIYVEVNSGTCVSNGYDIINDITTCESAYRYVHGRQAANSLTATGYDAVHNLPSGCYASMPTRASYSSSHTRVTLNTNTNNVQCRTENGVFGCLCAFTGPNCTHDDALMANAGPCVCGSSVCKSTTGLFCDTSDTGRCLQYPMCSNVDAIIRNTEDCVCGTGDTVCTATNGRFCDAYNNLCTFVGKCANTDGSAANAQVCSCANTVCDDVSGLFCDAENSQCNTIATCANLNGITFNQENCPCGTTVCDGTMGRFCDYSKNSCRFFPYCTNTDGTVANTANCACGTTDCTSIDGFYCNSNLNQCSTTIFKTVYPLVTSGTCQSNGYDLITNVTTCKAVAQQVGWYDGGWYYDITQLNEFLYPPGCSRQNFLTFNPREPNSWYDKNCERYSYASGCICEITTRVCAHTDGSTVNLAPCACGSDACTSSKGLFCDASNSRCNTIAACVNTDGTAANLANCPCGNTDCDTSTGLFCDASNSRCNTLAACVNTDGTAANLANCACNTTDCDTSTGLFCDASKSQCDELPYCINTDGSAANPSSCECGTADCDEASGLFCDASKNSCSKVVGSHVTVYPIVTSGTCADQGYGWITNAATCRLAAGQVGWSDTSASTWRSGLGLPRGCLDTSSSTSGGNLQFNTDTASTRSCDYPDAKACLCTFTGAACPHDELAATNAGPCVCGLSACASSTGLFCDISKNQCDSVPYCTRKNGTVANDVKCRCGTDHCDADTTGLFCDFSKNQCNNVPYCDNNNGTLANPETCICGSTTCDLERPFCDVSNNICNKFPGETLRGHPIVTSGTCESNGFMAISDASACSSSAGNVGWRDRSVSVITNPLFPGGCFDKVSSSIGGGLWFNDASSSSSCVSQDSKACLCTFQAPACPNKFGSTPNEHACVCGTNACSATDSYCYEVISMCDDEPIPGCPNGDGITPLTSTCLCGNDPCSPGQFCDDSIGKCDDVPYCVHTNGVLSNTHHASCHCGSVDCNVTSSYCDISKNQCHPLPYCINADGTYNSNDCRCGTDTCHQQSPFCDISKNSCRSYPRCASREGEVFNTFGCSCGDVVCDSTTGLLCFANENRCSFDICDNRDGLIPNVLNCICNSTVCESGYICVESDNRCDAPPCVKVRGNEANVQSCMCGSLNVCTPGTGLFCDIGNNFTCSSEPTCTNTSGVNINSEQCTCGTEKCNAGEYCYAAQSACAPYIHPRKIGEQTRPACYHQCGKKSNSPGCICGDSECTIDSGLLCYAPTGTCTRPQTCEVTDGSIKNDRTCTCGKTECEAEQYCFADINACTSQAQCHNTNGTRPNVEMCACGMEDCDTTTGLYCQYRTDNWLFQWGQCNHTTVVPC